MFNAAFFLRIKRAFAGCALALLLAHSAAAQSIDLSLNVYYENQADENSGGLWELVAKSSGGTFGISGLSVRLTDILTAQNRAPRGTVNGSNPAGFTVFFNNPFPNAGNPLYHNLTIGFGAPTPSGDENAIYGVGTLLNGGPNYPGNPGTTSAGPLIASFTNPQGSIPWGVGDSPFFNDPVWDQAVIMASGTFAEGITPGFFPGSTGNVFTTTPATAAEYGAIAFQVETNTIVRNNFLPPFPDYNDNGFVDAADYVLWRNGGPLLNDATPGVQPTDYDVWRSKFGEPVPGAGGDVSLAAVPEPASYLLLAIGLLVVLAVSRRNFAPHRAVCLVANRPKTARNSSGVEQEWR